MKKSIRTLIGASVAAVLGSALLLGGAGTLAFWSDTTSSAPQAIQSGQLDLGSSAELTATNLMIKQCAPQCSETTTSAPYAGGALVPGDVITATVNVPVALVGDNMKAKLAVTTPAPTATSGPKNDALKAALSIKVTKIGTTAFATDSTSERAVTLTPASLGGAKTVPVVIEIAFPWGTTGQYNDTMGAQVAFSAAYTLTQIAK